MNSTKIVLTNKTVSPVNSCKSVRPVNSNNSYTVSSNNSLRLINNFSKPVRPSDVRKSGISVISNKLNPVDVCKPVLPISVCKPVSSVDIRKFFFADYWSLFIFYFIVFCSVRNCYCY